MSKFADSTAERCQVVGTSGVISLLGNINKHRTFANAGLDGDVYVRVETSAGLWELSVGTFDPEANTITRTEFVSSITGSAINFPAGTHTCYSVLPADKVGSVSSPLVIGEPDQEAYITPAGSEGTNAAGRSVEIYPSASTGLGAGGNVKLFAGSSGESFGSSPNAVVEVFSTGVIQNTSLRPMKLPLNNAGESTDADDGAVCSAVGGGLLQAIGGVWVAL